MFICSAISVVAGADGTDGGWRNKGGSPGAALRAALLALSVAGAASACAGGAPIPPLDQPSDDPRLRAQEAELWEESRSLEALIVLEERLYSEPALDSYLASVVSRLVGDRFAQTDAKPVVEVIQDPTPNAATYPHGKLFVNTGLLALAENEAELASVLAHEIAHFRYRHGLRSMRAARRDAFVGTLIGGGALLAIARALGVLPPGYMNAGSLYALMASRGYGRELEHEADQAAVRALDRAGYAPQALITLLERIQESSDFEESPDSVWSTHPSLADRIARARALLVVDVAAPHPAEAAQDGLRELGAERYRRAVADARLINVELDLEQREFEHARETIERVLEHDPANARALFLRAETLRKTHPDASELRAQIEAYQAVLRVDPDLIEAEAELGWLYRQQGQIQKALEAFTAYVEHAPERSPRAAILQGYIERWRAAALPGARP